MPGALRHMVRFESADGSLVYRIPDHRRSDSSSQVFRTEYVELVSQGYPLDTIGKGSSLRSRGEEVVNFTAYGSNAGSVEEEVDRCLSICWRIGRGKLWMRLSTGEMRWCWARLRSRPSYGVNPQQILWTKLNVVFDRLSDWYGRHRKIVVPLDKVAVENQFINGGDIPSPASIMLSTKAYIRSGSEVTVQGGQWLTDDGWRASGSGVTVLPTSANLLGLSTEAFYANMIQLPFPLRRGYSITVPFVSRSTTLTTVWTSGNIATTIGNTYTVALKIKIPEDWDLGQMEWIGGTEVESYPPDKSIRGEWQTAYFVFIATSARSNIILRLKTGISTSVMRVIDVAGESCWEGDSPALIIGPSGLDAAMTTQEFLWTSALVNAQFVVAFSFTPMWGTPRNVSGFPNLWYWHPHSISYHQASNQWRFNTTPSVPGISAGSNPPGKTFVFCVESSRNRACFTVDGKFSTSIRSGSMPALPTVKARLGVRGYNNNDYAFGSVNWVAYGHGVISPDVQSAFEEFGSRVPLEDEIPKSFGLVSLWGGDIIKGSGADSQDDILVGKGVSIINPYIRISPSYTDIQWNRTVLDGESVQVDASRAAVEFNSGSGWVDDYASVTIKPTQAELLRVDPGENIFRITRTAGTGGQAIIEWDEAHG